MPAAAAILDAYATLGSERDTALSPDELLAAMDRAGVARAIIAPEDREIAVRNKEGNRRIARLAKDSSGRFIPACSVNPWYGGEGPRLLRTAVRAGAKVLVLAPAVQGFYLGDEVADALLETAGELRVPVYIHTGPHSAAAPTQLVLVAAKHPQTRFILAHCGSTDLAHDMRAVIAVAPPNVWFETSLVRPWALPVYARLAGDRRLIFGSSMPRNDLAFELEHASQHLPIAEHPGVYGSTLAALLAGDKA